MSDFFHRFYRAVFRVFPNCITQTQAVAFNMFLAFSPMLLVVLGVVAGSDAFRQAMLGIIDSPARCASAGTLGILNRFLIQHSTHPWQWILLGWEERCSRELK